jgi:hypothetical protein
LTTFEPEENSRNPFGLGLGLVADPLTELGSPPSFSLQSLKGSVNESRKIPIQSKSSISIIYDRLVYAFI